MELPQIINYRHRFIYDYITYPTNTHHYGLVEEYKMKTKTLEASKSAMFISS